MKRMYLLHQVHQRANGILRNDGLATGTRLPLTQMQLRAQIKALPLHNLHNRWPNSAKHQLLVC